MSAWRSVGALRRGAVFLAFVAAIASSLTGCTTSGGADAEARAEAALKIMVAQSAGDQETLVKMSSGKLAEQAASPEYDEPASKVEVANKEWDGKKLNATVTDINEGSTDVIQVVITPDVKSDNVEIRQSGPAVDGTEAEMVVMVLVLEDGAWKAKDYLIGGTTSWVDAVEQSQKDMPPESQWMNEEDTSPPSVCKRNQAAIEGAFMEKIEGGNAGIDLSSYKGGSVKDLEGGPAAIMPEPLKTMPRCPTETTDYTYEIQTMEGKGTFITITCSNPEHRR